MEPLDHRDRLALMEHLDLRVYLAPMVCLDNRDLPV